MLFCAALASADAQQELAAGFTLRMKHSRFDAVTQGLGR
jgi:hypothetical protein